MKLENEEGGKASFLECQSLEVFAPLPQGQPGASQARKALALVVPGAQPAGTSV